MSIYCPVFFGFYSAKTCSCGCVVCAATGGGEKVLDYFLIETADEKIPATLKEIMDQASFIKQMITIFFDQGTETLMVTAALSNPNGKEKINNFMGINKKDFDRIL